MILINIFSIFIPGLCRMTLWLTLLYLICPYTFSKSYKHLFLCWCMLLVYQRDRPYTWFLFLGKIFSLKTNFLWKCDIHFIFNPGLCRLTLIVSQVYVEWPFVTYITAFHLPINFSYKLKIPVSLLMHDRSISER